MRDDTANWPAPFAEGPLLKTPRLTLRRLPRLNQAIVSGPELSVALPAGTYPRVQWPDLAPLGTAALVLRRDRLLVLDSDLRPGWYAARGCAVSDASESLTVFEISGPDALALVAQFCEISVAHPSASVMRRVAGLDVALYCINTPERLRLHVPAAAAPGLWTLLAAGLPLPL